VDWSHGTQIPRSQRERELLAKEWLLRLIERTPLAELGELPVAWIVAEAPTLIAEILAKLEHDDGAPGSAEEALVHSLTRLRAGPAAAEEIPRDLALLQSLLIESLHGGITRARYAGIGHTAERLAEVFGGIQGRVNRSLVEQRGEAPTRALGAQHGAPELRDWMRALLAQHERFGFGFGFAMFDVDGLSRINEAYGSAAGDRIVGALGNVIRGQIRATDRAFRFDEDEFGVLAPHSDVAGLLAMCERIAELIDSSQAADGPLISITIGVVACPGDGTTEEALFEGATAAAYAAKAAGRSVGTNPDGPRAALQDR
jgi:diguanylate cyclase (GGDEF)-like protein